jgi:hypothetical protein
MNIESVLGIDLAQSWANTGIALVGFDRASERIITVDVAVSAAPTRAFSAAALADVIDDLAMRHGVRAVAIDGPLGWRDPSTPPEAKGVGRRCEVECRTQAKTGAYPTTYPNNQRPWVELSIAVFDALLAREHVVLANDDALHIPVGGYAVLECFPTSLWRSSGLAALPGKAARPDLGGYIAALRAAYDLPAFTTSSHDALQAVVAALAALAVVGGPARPIPRGVPARIVDVGGTRRRVEGFIWNAAPLAVAGAEASPARWSKEDGGVRARGAGGRH